jgi:hypothetical protein
MEIGDLTAVGDAGSTQPGPSSAGDRQPSHSDPGTFEDNHTALGQVVGYGIKVVDKQGDLSFGPPAHAVPESDDRGLARPLDASMAPKSVSAEIRTLSSRLARPNTSSSSADCIPRSRR